LGKEVLRERLEAMYPGSFTLDHEAEGSGYRAKLIIDLRTAHAALRTA
jgi:hypothetical protein